MFEDDDPRADSEDRDWVPLIPLVLIGLGVGIGAWHLFSEYMKTHQ